MFEDDFLDISSGFNPSENPNMEDLLKILNSDVISKLKNIQESINQAKEDLARISRETSPQDFINPNFISKNKQ